MRRAIARQYSAGPALLSSVLLSSAVLVLMALPAGPAAAAPDRDGRVVFTIGPSEITESSSLVISTTHPQLVYTTNDSGDSATVYVLDSRTGELVGQTSLLGVDAIDVEALAGGDDGSLVVADIGDNGSQREQVVLYKIPQPGPGDHSVSPDALRVTYSDGPRDAESALYDAETGRVFVISKDYAEAHIYRSPPDAFSGRSAVLHRVAPAPGIATDATFLPGAEFAAIRTYLAVAYYTYPGWEQVTTEGLPIQEQGESVAAPPGGKELWIGSEGVHSQVLAVPIPDLSPPEPPTTAPPTTASPPPTADDEHRDEVKGQAVVVIIIAVGLLALVLGGLIIRFIRHPRS